jgi:hypothetical protein
LSQRPDLVAKLNKDYGPHEMVSDPELDALLGEGE